MPKRCKRWQVVLSAGIGILLVLYLLSPYLAAWLVVSEPLRPADAIVVLGGSYERALHGYELYRDGYAPRLVVSGARLHDFTLNGRPFTEANFSKVFLQGLGVPAQAIILLEFTGTTYAEARAVARLSREQPWKRLILVSSPYHTRRANLTFLKQLRGTGIDLIVRPARQSWFRIRRAYSFNWVEAVLHEYAGLFYYWLLGRL